MPLTGKQRRELMARSHTLKPSLIVTAGVSPSISTHLRQLLEKQDLVKVRLATEDRDQCNAWAAELAKSAQSELVRRTGRVAIYYRTPAPAADDRDIN
jgi:RNA-binding protein